jgi:hypothetical protein
MVSFKFELPLFGIVATSTRAYARRCPIHGSDGVAFKKLARRVKHVFGMQVGAVNNPNLGTAPQASHVLYRLGQIPDES